MPTHLPLNMRVGFNSYWYSASHNISWQISGILGRIPLNVYRKRILNLNALVLAQSSISSYRSI